MTNNQQGIDDIRGSVNISDYEHGFGVQQSGIDAARQSEGKIFGLTAGERMLLSIILFLSATVGSIAFLLATGTIALP